MSIQAILLPVFVQVALMFVVGIWMAVARMGAFRSGQMRPEDVALRQDRWPPRVKQIGDSYRNQFEAPVLFFALVPLAIITRKADLAFVVMAWLFVLSRIVQAWIHTTSNFVPARGGAFALGIVILLLMWVIFAVRILSVPAIG